MSTDPNKYETITYKNKKFKVHERINNDYSGVYSLVNVKSNSINSKYIIKINEGKANERRFNLEIELLSKLNCKYVVKCYGSGFTTYKNNRRKYYILKKYDCDFRKLMESDKSINIKLELFLKICKCIKYIHKKNIIHRDIKPENILYDTKTKKIVLCDFGIAKRNDKVNISVA